MGKGEQTQVPLVVSILTPDGVGFSGFSLQLCMVIAEVSWV
jgi:hypothetical protein